MVFTTDGTPLQGITGGWGGDRRVEYIIPRSAIKAGKHEIVIESSCNGMFGVPWNGDTIAPPDVSLIVNFRFNRSALSGNAADESLLRTRVCRPC